jgi:hypothetical protein
LTVAKANKPEATAIIRVENRKAKLPAKSKEQLAARAAKKAAKKMAKQTERRERAERNNRASASASASKRQPRATASAGEGKVARARKVQHSINAAAHTATSAAEPVVVVPSAGVASWFKRTLSGSIALLLVTLLLLAGLGWFLWPRS